VDRIISIKLFDRAYSFKTDAEVAHAKQITAHVVKEVEKAEASGEVPGKLDTLILAALNIANDYFEAKRGCEALLSQIENRCRDLITYIEENEQGEAPRPKVGGSA
jgi:cell division protein ZapA (FtsZ GTPase activity inhibitor)